MPDVLAGQQCAHCGGNVLTIWDETKCLQCGREPKEWKISSSSFSYRSWPSGGGLTTPGVTKTRESA